LPTTPPIPDGSIIPAIIRSANDKDVKSPSVETLEFKFLILCKTEKFFINSGV